MSRAKRWAAIRGGILFAKNEAASVPVKGMKLMFDDDLAYAAWFRTATRINIWEKKLADTALIVARARHAAHVALVNDVQAQGMPAVRARDLNGRLADLSLAFLRASPGSGDLDGLIVSLETLAGDYALRQSGQMPKPYSTFSWDWQNVAAWDAAQALRGIPVQLKQATAEALYQAADDFRRDFHEDVPTWLRFRGMAAEPHPEVGS